MSRRVEIRIDQLVLHGYSPARRQAVREAVERELARAAQEGSVPGAQQIGGRLGQAVRKIEP